ncbi:hypothetical protein FRB91_001235 [Serendipita sp. 411]|nr:hypothetical protein FRC18_000871 [Serendipita sp. 400]KAG8856119.1 hypothetical protein FRB91_001235 [Serendipita sp. 411]
MSTEHHGPQSHLSTQLFDWKRSDEYHNSFLIAPDEQLERAHQRTLDAGMPDIAVSEAQGKLLMLLCKSINAKRVLEVGTLAGYSTIWMAKALPDDGLIVTHELLPEHAEVATENVAHAGFSNKVKIVVGPAVDTLPNLPSSEPFDLAFIDADKENNLNYFKQAERLIRPGGVIIVDNVVRRGRTADPDVIDQSVEGVRALLKYIKADAKVEATTIATVGMKGYDGFLYALKTA